MVSTRQFRYHSSVGFVNFDLGVDRVREDRPSVPYQGSRTIVTRAFNAQNQHVRVFQCGKYLDADCANKKNNNTTETDRNTKPSK